MSKYSWDDKSNRQIQELCIRCHWRDKSPDLCHVIEPPAEKPESLMNGKDITQDCGFIPDSYWNRIPQERKDELNAEVQQRSARYYKRH